MPATAFQKLESARADYAMTGGDGFGEYDWIGANDYADEGYELAEAAFDMPAEDRDDWIDAQSYAFPASAQYLVAVAADYRLAELVAADAYPFHAEPQQALAPKAQERRAA